MSDGGLRRGSGGIVEPANQPRQPTALLCRLSWGCGSQACGATQQWRLNESLGLELV